jgi:hypothetical protein
VPKVFHLLHVLESNGLAFFAKFGIVIGQMLFDTEFGAALFAD